jgi:rhodanese-related sulfurtransferase
MNIKNIDSILAYNILVNNDNSLLVDVRTPEEWATIGIPKLVKNNLVFLTWRLLPDMSINKEFRTRFISLIQGKMYFVLFLCRSGVRSLEALSFAMNIGYVNCYNIYDGFEGSGNNNGWKYNNLPWQII